ncbi:MAG: nucleoside-diphosphate sugar epimerase/dehydratase [Candidatus Levybacteria bacterium]|nr:nucleoside-diphosphate sugar epimerase/dehydratase [Candidatus Levybacteria bacterium]
MTKALIIGAGVAGKELLEELRKHKSIKVEVVGFIDDDLRKIGKRVLGVQVLGQINGLRMAIKKYKVSEVFIAIPSAKGGIIRKIIEKCKDLNIAFKVIPRTLDIIQGKVAISQIRDVDVSDLIGREMVQMEQNALINFFKGKKILITGACGSIGHEICRQLALFSPKKLIFYDWWENGMFDLDLEFKSKFTNISTKSIIGDIKDEVKVDRVFKEEKPDIIFHAAAYKHVPLMEDNPSEAVKNNVFGTMVIAKIAKKYTSSHFVLISTDKAVYPKNVMGATKRIAESIVSEFSKKSFTKFISVRFGNVLDSFGSVLPLFKKQISEGGPVTVTHKNMQRFFMSIPEAVQLIFQATVFGKGGEIFILDMGEQIRIVDLAKLLIKLSGLVPQKDIKIVYTGLRPGEKFSEELFTEKENLTKTLNKKIFIAENSNLELKDSEGIIKTLLQHANHFSDEMVREDLSKIFTSFKN